MTNLATPALDLDFTADVLPPGLVHTRTSLAWAYNSDGVLATVAHNLLVSPQTFTAAAWNKACSNATAIPVVTADFDVAPDGTTTASRVVLTAPGDAEWATVRVTAMTLNIAPHAASIYLKANGAGQIGKKVNFGLFNGSVFVSMTTTVLTAAWQRVSAPSVVNMGSGTVNEIFVGKHRIANGGATNAEISTDFLIWGAQLEQHPIVRPYINPMPRNLLSYTEDFSHALWSKVAVGTGSAPVVTANAGTDPLGGSTADQVVFALNGGVTSGDRSDLTQVLATVVGVTYTFSVWLKTTDASTKAVRIDFNGATGTSPLVSVTGTWQRFSTTIAAAGVIYYPAIRLRGSLSTADSASLYVWGAQFEASSVLSDYQANAAAPVPVTGPKHMPAFAFDPVSLRANLLTLSNDFTTGAGWSITSVPDSSLVDPYGGRAAYALNLPVNTDVNYRVVSVTPSTTYTFSYFVKLGTKSVNRNAIFDHTNSAFIVASADVVGPNTSTWVRVSLPFTTPSTCTQVRLYNDRANTGVTGINYFFGAMLETGGSSTEYIATTTTTATAGPVATRGLRIEESRTNSISQSWNLAAGAPWGSNGATRTASAAMAPDGTLSATLLADTDAANSQYVDCSYTVPGGDTAWYTWSVHVKAGSSPSCAIRLYLTGGTTSLGSGHGFIFTFATKAMSGIGPNPATDCGFDDIGGGWFRLWTRLQNNATGNTTCVNRLQPTNGTASSTGSCYCWGGQSEAGAFMTSYIHNTGTTQTRARDDITLTLGNWFNATEGTLTSDIHIPQQIAFTGSAVSFGICDNSGTANNIVYMPHQTTFDGFNVNTGGVAQMAQARGTPPVVPKRVALAYKLDDFSITRDGAAVTLDTLGTLPTGLDRAGIGRAPWGAANYLNGYARHLRYFNSRILDAEVQTVTVSVAVPAPQIVYAGITALDTPAVGQVHNLATASVPSIASPTLGTPALAQTHNLTLAAAATGNPTLATTAITQSHTLQASGLAAGVIPLDNPIFAQTHVLAAAIGVTTGAITANHPRLRAGLAVAAPRMYEQPRIGY